MLTTNSLSMQSATFDYDPSLAGEEDTTIDARDRIRLLIAALATQLVLGATARSLYSQSEQTVDQTVNLLEI
ncbi:MAG TPA: hypothetical protein VFO40_24335 [Chthoniobacterales bacterium]|nr:hypothetical protein [Chthoniobacterales bacterium]